MILLKERGNKIMKLGYKMAENFEDNFIFESFSNKIFYYLVSNKSEKFLLDRIEKLKTINSKIRLLSIATISFKLIKTLKNLKLYNNEGNLLKIEDNEIVIRLPGYWTNSNKDLEEVINIVNFLENEEN